MCGPGGKIIKQASPVLDIRMELRREAEVSISPTEGYLELEKKGPFTCQGWNNAVQDS